MSAHPPAVRRDPGYIGLTTKVATLPSQWYFDAAHYQGELSRIWYRNWIYACRASDLPAARSFRTLTVGDQSVLIVRDEAGSLRAFHNTCRHRGSMLCRTAEGRVPAAGIVCPYHSWRYSLQGELLQTSSQQPGDGFNKRDFPLYALPLTEWNGFLFIALGATFVFKPW